MFPLSINERLSIACQCFEIPLRGFLDEKRSLPLFKAERVKLGAEKLKSRENLNCFNGQQENKLETSN